RVLFRSQPEANCRSVGERTRFGGGAATSLLTQGEVRNTLDTLRVVDKAMFRQPNVVGDGTTGRCGEVSGETCAVGGERRRSQSLHSTEAVKAAPREGRQEGGHVSSTGKQSESEAPAVLKLATQGADTQGRDWSWVEASVWTVRLRRRKTASKEVNGSA